MRAVSSGGPTHPKGIRREFVVEARDVLEAVARDLLILEHGIARQNVDPKITYNLLRSVHTLKGLAGMFGFGEVGALAHAVEGLLERMRRGQVELTQDSLDLLLDGLELFERLLAAIEGSGAGPDADIARYTRALEPSSDPDPRSRGDEMPFDLAPDLARALTSHERDRIRHHADRGGALYRLRFRCEVVALEREIDAIRRRLGASSELLTYLPVDGAVEPDALELDVLFLSEAPREALENALGNDAHHLIDVPRVDASRRSLIDSGAALLAADLPSQSPLISLPPPPTTPPPIAERVSILPAPPGDGMRTTFVEELSLRAASSTVRVDIAELDHLMHVIGELGIVRASVSRIADEIRRRPELRGITNQLHRAQRALDRNLRALQDGVLGARLVPIGQTFDKLQRLVRQVAREHDKEVRLTLDGADTELDKLIVEELSDPLMHLVRNAISHGTEPEHVRIEAGKPAVGTIAVRAMPRGRHVVIEVEDDGAGIDPNKLAAAAVREGLVRADADLPSALPDAATLIFLPGFSTRDSVNALSGRGVGLDVVKTNLSRIGGVIDVRSTLGAGTKFTLTVPITLSIVKAVTVRVGAELYAIPLASVEEAMRFDESTVRKIQDREVITLRGATLAICRLNTLFFEEGPTTRAYLVVVALGARRIGLVVDQLISQEDIVVKALGPSLRSARIFAGATQLGVDRVALVIDIAALMEETLSPSQEAAIRWGTAP